MVIQEGQCVINDYGSVDTANIYHDLAKSDFLLDEMLACKKASYRFATHYLKKCVKITIINFKIKIIQSIIEDSSRYKLRPTYVTSKLITPFHYLCLFPRNERLTRTCITLIL